MRQPHLQGLLVCLVLLFAGEIRAGEFRGLWVDAFGPGFYNSNQVAELVKDCRAYWPVSTLPYYWETTKLVPVTAGGGATVAPHDVTFPSAPAYQSGPFGNYYLPTTSPTRTTVSLGWVGQALSMGHYTRVTQAVSRMNRKPARKLKSLKRRLLKTEGQNA